MKRWLTLLAGLTFLLALPADEAEAQVAFGPQLSLWDFDELAIGARLDWSLAPTLGLENEPFDELFLSVDGNWLVDTGDLTVLVFDVNVAVPFEVEGAFTPYAGAGLNFLRQSGDIGPGLSFSDTSTGLNLLGGIFFNLGNVPAYTQLQYWTTGPGGLTLSAGVLFGG